MINKRLLNAVDNSKKYIWLNVILQWVSLIANIILMIAITKLLSDLFKRDIDTNVFIMTGIIAIISITIRFICTIGSTKMSYLSSESVKTTLRNKIYKKLLSLGSSYKEKVKTSEVVQIAVEGVEQLETYFGAYLPQFFYAMIAPITLFIVLCFVNVPSAIVLLVCVPLIPISIALVQTWAKKLLSKYWGQYTTLGDTFLENLQGLTTLKIYQADKFKQDEMNEQAEKFRKITMKVLTMQLNSITIMDLIAFGGAGLGVVMAISQYQSGNVSLAGCILIIMLSAEFFIPMRLLGSFFHIAMNGMAASDKIFRLLDIEENSKNDLKEFPKDYTIKFENVSFAYEENRDILKNINITLEKGNFISIVGESGCGKSTIASIIMGRNKNYNGKVMVGDIELRQIAEDSLFKNICYISHQSYLFKGTVRENLLMGNCTSSDEQLWEVLDRVNLSGFLKSENGLDTLLLEKASNLSGGQCQRLALARALLHDSPIYIFDEATSNIDVDSENDIMKEIYELSKTKTILFISHRLANVVNADKIYVMENKKIVEVGTHKELIQNKNVYLKLWTAQQNLENYSVEEVKYEKA